MLKYIHLCFVSCMFCYMVNPVSYCRQSVMSGSVFVSVCQTSQSQRVRMGIMISVVQQQSSEPKSFPTLSILLNNMPSESEYIESYNNDYTTNFWDTTLYSEMCGNHFEIIIFRFMLPIEFLEHHCQIALRCMPQSPVSQEANAWANVDPMSPYGVIKAPWVYIPSSL